MGDTWLKEGAEAWVSCLGLSCRVTVEGVYKDEVFVSDENDGFMGGGAYDIANVHPTELAALHASSEMLEARLATVNARIAEVESQPPAATEAE